MIPQTVRRMTRAALALAAALLALLQVAPASATVYPGERPAGPRAQQIKDMAVAFWTARNVIACPGGVQLLQAPSLAGADAADPFGRGDNCTAWISGQTAADIDGAESYEAGLGFGCSVIFHEVGHALGLPHSESGVMSAGAPSYPYECLVWTHRTLREINRPAREKREKRAAQAARAARSNARSRHKRSYRMARRP